MVSNLKIPNSHSVGEEERRNWDRKDWVDKVVDAFERLVTEGSKKQLNEVKKKEVNAIRR